MSIREQTEQLEQMILSPCATLSTDTRGRERPETECDIRTAFQRDRDRILHCKSFRRLKHKTQVFLSPQGDHYRTRLTHTLEVSQIARTIAKALKLNEELVEAIALGHDLGHTPFGHAGERVLNRLCQGGFKHSQQSLRVVDRLEKDGIGLNLTWEVRDGILNHQMSTTPATLEGNVVRLSDKIAYIHHDIDDAVRAHLLREEEIPAQIREVLGNDTKARLNTLVHDIIEQSVGKAEICMSEQVSASMLELRGYLYTRVYRDPVAKGEESRAEELLARLFHYYENHLELLPEQYLDMYRNGEPKERVICDYIAGMTDQYAIAKFNEYFIPKAWTVN